MDKDCDFNKTEVIVKFRNGENTLFQNPIIVKGIKRILRKHLHIDYQR